MKEENRGLCGRQDEEEYETFVERVGGDDRREVTASRDPQERREREVKENHWSKPGYRNLCRVRV